MVTLPFVPRPAIGNQLLNALLKAEYERLLPHLEQISLSLGEAIYEVDEPIRYVYFPETSVISILSTMEDGSTVEVGLVGNEGMLGIRVMFGARTTPHSAVVQVAGTAMRMSAEMLDRELRLGSPLQALLLRYTGALLNQVRQSLACNNRHSVNERLARWLLSMQDYAGTNELVLTHEIIAAMMGNRRAGVTTAMGKLRDRGLIDSSRGNVTITDRQGLEAATCECYQIVKDEFAQLYGRVDESRAS